MKFRVPKPEERSLFSAVFMINWLDCPHLLIPEKKLFREKMIALHGLNSSLVRSMMFGEFMRDSDDDHVFMQYDMDALREVMKNGVGVKGVARAAIDLSTTGEGDEKVMYIALGTEVLPAFTTCEPDTTKVGDFFVSILKRYGVEPHRCRVDNGGSGKPIVDYIERIGYRPVVRYMNNQTPRYRFEYKDLITEDHYAFKELLHTTKMKLPYDMLLLAQAKQRQVVVDDHSKIKLVSKRTLRAWNVDSPDRLDCMMMLWSGFTPQAGAQAADPVKSPWSLAAVAHPFQKPAARNSMHGLSKAVPPRQLAAASGYAPRKPW